MYEFKKNGTVVRRVTNRYSTDGKTRTVRIKRSDPQGQTLKDLLVFDQRE